MTPGRQFSSEPFIYASRAQWAAAACALLIYLVLSVGLSLSRSPWWDEGLFADIAINFRNFGHLGSSVLAPSGYLDLPGVHQYTFFQFPLYLLALGGWFRLVPATVVSMRLFSVMWGCVFILSWFVVLRSLSRNEPLSLLVASVVALEYESVVKASTGRMDMMCAALGLAGLASYFWFRDSNRSRGVILAAWFEAASLFCHPMGAVMNAVAAAVIIWDLRRINWRLIAAASLPYLTGTAWCLYYIHQAPGVFWAQSKAASEYRVRGIGVVLLGVLNDANARYIHSYAGYAGILNLSAICLVFLAVGMVALLKDRNLRRQPEANRLLLSAAIAYAGVAIVDGMKFPHYLIFSIPFFAACGAVWVYDRWREGGLGRWVACSLLAANLLIGIGGAGYRIRRNEYRQLYDPAVEFVRSQLPSNGLVMGGSELGFALGFGRPLVDDRYLGFFSGERPAMFVENKFYGLPWRSPRFANALSSSRSELGKKYHLAFSNDAYKVYLRNASPSVAHLSATR
jgi:hypothetical protein